MQRVGMLHCMCPCDENEKLCWPERGERPQGQTIQPLMWSCGTQTWERAQNNEKYADHDQDAHRAAENNFYKLLKSRPQKKIPSTSVYNDFMVASLVASLIISKWNPSWRDWSEQMLALVNKSNHFARKTTNRRLTGYLGCIFRSTRLGNWFLLAYFLSIFSQADILKFKLFNSFNEKSECPLFAIMTALFKGQVKKNVIFYSPSCYPKRVWLHTEENVLWNV